MSAQEFRQALLAQRPAASAPLAVINKPASEALGQVDLPGRRNERWKYTSLSSLYTRRFAEVPSVLPEQVSTWSSEADCLLVAVDGVFQPQLSRLGGAVEFKRPQSCDAAELKARAEACPESNEWYAAWNGAWLEDLLWLSLPSGQRAQVELVNLHTRAEGSGHMRLWVDVAAHAELTLVERMAVEGHAGMTTWLVDAQLASGARMEHVREAFPGDEDSVLAALDVSLQRDAHYRLHSFAGGARLHRQALRARLLGQGAFASVNGVYLSGRKTQLDTRLEVEHIAPHCNSEELWRGLSGGRGRSSFIGRIFIERDAQKSDAQLSCGNLLLSSGAEINAKPELEIYADDVKCAHGATVGQLDAQQVNYLRSRGISDRQARSMLAFGFVNELVMRLDDAAVAEHIKHLLRDQFDRALELA